VSLYLFQIPRHESKKAMRHTEPPNLIITLRDCNNIFRKQKYFPNIGQTVGAVGSANLSEGIRE